MYYFVNLTQLRELGGICLWNLKTCDQSELNITGQLELIWHPNNQFGILVIVAQIGAQSKQFQESGGIIVLIMLVE